MTTLSNSSESDNKPEYCSYCGGNKYVEWNLGGSSEGGPSRYTCPRCAGSGQVIKCKSCKGTGSSDPIVQEQGIPRDGYGSTSYLFPVESPCKTCDGAGFMLYFEKPE